MRTQFTSPMRVTAEASSLGRASGRTPWASAIKVRVRTVQHLKCQSVVVMAQWKSTLSSWDRHVTTSPTCLMRLTESLISMRDRSTTRMRRLWSSNQSKESDLLHHRNQVRNLDHPEFGCLIKRIQDLPCRDRLVTF